MRISIGLLLTLLGLLASAIVWAYTSFPDRTYVDQKHEIAMTAIRAQGSVIHSQNDDLRAIRTTVERMDQNILELARHKH